MVYCCRGRGFAIFFIVGSLIVQATVGGYVLSNLASVDAEESFDDSRRKVRGFGG